MGRGLLILVLVAGAIATTQAAQCAYTTYTSCPWYEFWNWWSSCSRTAYRYCVHGGWSAWREQSRTSCTRSCGGGTYVSTQSRSCTNPSPSGGGNGCSGVSTKRITVSCNTHRCPVDGRWSAWGDWEDSGQCTVTCGGGQKYQSRDRSCIGPLYGGRACVGGTTEQRTVECNTQECPIDGSWTDWSDWEDSSQCTVSCGGGEKDQSRDRSCTYPRPQYGGRACAGGNTEQRTVDCNTQECPIDGNWTDWSVWVNSSQCTVTCGGGERNQSRDRSCTNPQPQYGGRTCVGESTEEKVIACNTQECPIDGNWTDWSDWEDTSKCTVFCGEGEKNQTRDRSCTNPEPQFGGLDCDGENTQDRTIACNSDECGSLCPEGENTFIADTEAEYYYHCQQGDNSTVSTKAVLRQCSEGTTWNQDIKNCVHKAVSTTTTTTTTTTPAPAPAPSCTEGTSRADPDDCTFYLQCFGGSELRRPCSAGTKFDKSLGQCNTASLVSC